MGNPSFYEELTNSELAAKIDAIVEALALMIDCETQFNLKEHSIILSFPDFPLNPTSSVNVQRIASSNQGANNVVCSVVDGKWCCKPTQAP